MATSPDIATLLRQQQILADLNRISQQSPTSDLVNFGTPKKPSGSTGIPSITPTSSAATLGDTQAKPQQAVGTDPLSQVQAATRNLMQGIKNKVSGVITSPIQASQDANAAATIGARNSEPANAPTMITNTGGQPTPGPGMMVTGTPGNTAVAPSPNSQAIMDQLTPQRWKYDPSQLPLISGL